MSATAEVYPLQVVIASRAGLMIRRQPEVLDYVIEESGVPRERLEGRALRLSDDPL